MREIYKRREENKNKDQNRNKNREEDKNKATRLRRKNNKFQYIKNSTPEIINNFKINMNNNNNHNHHYHLNNNKKVKVQHSVLNNLLKTNPKTKSKKLMKNHQINNNSYLNIITKSFIKIRILSDPF